MRRLGEMGSIMFDKLFKRLAKDDSGAVTVDWVVLTAAVVIMAIGAVSALREPMMALFGEINMQLVFDNISGAFQ